MYIEPLNIFETKPTISQLSLQAKKNLYLHYRHDLPGELNVRDGLSHHLITFFLSNNRRQITRLESFGEYDGQMDRGEFYLCPAKVSGFTNWQAIDKTLHFIIKPDFLREIAIDTESLNPDRVELLPILKQRDFQLEQLAQLFLAEMQNNGFGTQLYLDSLSNVLGVHLLRNYCAFDPIFRSNNRGLAADKLRHAVDYIQANLEQKIGLKVIAQEIGMSQYYFAVQFKQAMGVSPYQYVIEQRLIKAKQLLREKKRSLCEIALDCGFASQSHFNKVFRQYVGTTPKKYRQQ